MHASTYLRTIFGVAFGLVLFFIFSAQSTFAQVTCLLYQSNSAPPTNYGASWDVLSAAKELLIKSDCPTSGNTITMTVGKGDATQYIWQHSYMYNTALTPPKWATTTLAGTVDANGWITNGSGTKTITTPFMASASNPLYFVGFMCTYHSARWKCGCRDATCTQRYWQLQGYTGTGGGGSTTGAGTVATPTITPNGSTFTTSQSVSIAVTTSGAEIRYTLDGVDPTAASTLYTAPIMLTETKTVKAKGFKTGMTPSPTASAVFTKSGAAAKPNIIVVMTDDQDYGSLAKMPKVNSLLVGQGMSFTNYIANLSLCCPSRTTHFTGMYAHNHGILKQSPPPDSLATGYRENKSLPVWLRSAGYTTAFYGKYFNFYGGNADFPANHVPPGWDEWNGVPRNGATHLIHSYYNYTINENGTLRNYGTAAADYMTDRLTARALNFIQSQSTTTKPFYIQLSYVAPHDDLTTATGDPIPAPRHASAFASEALPRPPNFNEPDISDKPGFIASNHPVLTAAQITAMTTTYRKRLATLLAVDDAVEDIVDKLQDIGKLGNTYIIYISDNGWYAGAHRIAAGKESIYEESIRLPLVVRGPGIANSVNTKLLSNVDIAATIVDIANATPTVTFDGRSFLPILQGGGGAWRTAVRVDGTLDYDPVIPGNPGFDAVRTPRYMYAEHDNNQKELYDLSTDPYELTNKAGAPAYATVQTDLANKLDQLRACKGAACWITAPDLAP